MGRRTGARWDGPSGRRVPASAPHSQPRAAALARRSGRGRALHAARARNAGRVLLRARLSVCRPAGGRSSSATRRSRLHRGRPSLCRPLSGVDPPHHGSSHGGARICVQLCVGAIWCLVRACVRGSGRHGQCPRNCESSAGAWAYTTPGQDGPRSALGGPGGHAAQIIRKVSEGRRGRALFEGVSADVPPVLHAPPAPRKEASEIADACRAQTLGMFAPHFPALGPGSGEFTQSIPNIVAARLLKRAPVPTCGESVRVRAPEVPPGCLIDRLVGVAALGDSQRAP